MFKTILKSWCRYLGLWTSFFLIIAIVLMVAVGGLMVRLSQGPLNLDFAKSYIEKALSDLERNYVVQIDKASLTWPEVSSPFLLNLSNVQINQEVETVLAVDDFSLVLSGLDLLQGKIRPSRIIVTEPEFKLFKDNGKFNAFWRKDQGKPKNVYGPVKPFTTRENIRDLLAQITNPENQEVNLAAALRTIQIKDAKILGVKNKELAQLDLILKKHEQGLEADLSVEYLENQEKKARFKSDILYRSFEEDLTFTANLKDLHTSHVKPFLNDLDILDGQNLFLNGDLKAAFDKDLKLQNSMLSLNIPEADLSFPKLYDSSPRVENLTANILYNRKENKLELEDLKASVAGVPVTASMKGVIDDSKVVAPLSITIPSTTVKDLRKLLPKSQAKKAAGAWLNHKLEEGNISNVRLQANISFNKDSKTKKYIFDGDLPEVKFDFNNMTVKYSPTLAPVKKAVGSGKYVDDTLYIDGKEGYINGIKGRDIQVKVTNLSIRGGGIADINVKARGPLKAALKYVSDKPISVGDKLGFDLSEVQGDIDFTVNVNLPTIKGVPKEQVKVTLNGVVNDILLPNIVRDLSLTGGPYDLTYGQGSIALKGLGQLSGRNIDLDWKQYINPKGKEFESQIKATIVAGEALRQSFGIGLTDYLSGPVPVDIVYTDKGVDATLSVFGNLTPAKLMIDSFGYTKPENVEGDIKLNAFIKGADIKEINGLNLKTAGFSLSDGRLFFGKNSAGETDVKQGTIPSVQLKKNNIGVEFEITNENILKANIKGAVVDASHFIKTDKKRNRDAISQDNRPMVLSIDADKMIMPKGQNFKNTKLYLELNANSEPTRIEMDASVGEGEMFIRFKPDNNGDRNFQLNSTDAGAMLKAFGLYENMRGGQINISGKPKVSEAGNDLYGRAQITDFSIRGAPALAKMLDAMSLKGVDSLINNDGIVFKKLASDFEWKFKESGNLLVVKEGRTSGSSLGLTFKGIVNMGEGKTDLSGTAIPLSGVSKVIGQIPVIGDILGGGEGLFAVTYEMKGPSRDPKVSINPLSVLAPGFVRKILFEDDIDKKVKKEEAKQ